MLGGGAVFLVLAYLACSNDTDDPDPAQTAEAAAAGSPSDPPAVEPAPPLAEDGTGASTGSGDPPAVLTPSGIPVAVLDRTAAGYLVRTPCGSTAEVSAGVPIENARVVLDPGHGGRWDTGAVGPNGLVERDLNLKLSRAVLDELAERGIPAATTRTGDYSILHSVRAAFADSVGADALVSIHHNAPTWSPSSVPGSEVYVQSRTAEQVRADSARLGGLLYEEITAALATFDDIAWSGLPDAGVLRVLRSEGDDAYGMIRRPSVVTALVEYGYLSNPSEARLFATDEYIRVAAEATADAIDAYLHSDRPGTGFVQQPRTFNPSVSLNPLRRSCLGVEPRPQRVRAARRAFIRWRIRAWASGVPSWKVPNSLSSGTGRLP